MTIATALTKKLEIEHPVLLAPMAGVAGGALAAARLRSAQDLLT